MKGKLSATLDPQLIDFLDGLPGKNRSQKLGRIMRWYKKFEEEKQLRRQLSSSSESEEEKAERETWERTVAEAMWSE